MMSNSGKYLVVLLLCPIIMIVGCKESSPFGDGGQFNPSEDDCFNNCPYYTRCNNGKCECEPPLQTIAPGFCVAPLYGTINFVSYDVGPGCRDTVAIAFYDVDPYHTAWEWAGRSYIDVATQTYNRETVGVDGAGGAFVLKRPTDGDMNVDSVIIANIPFGSDHWGYCPFPTDTTAVRCFKVFRGRFTDSDTIEGEACFFNCLDRAPRPPSAEGCYPMVWHRLD